MWCILNNLWLTVNTNFCHSWGNDFHGWRSYEWKSLPNRLTSDENWYWRQSIHHFISYTLAYALIELTKPLKQSSIAHFAIFSKGGFFWLGTVTSPQTNLWRHANARYWHCGVIFLDCSCTRKVAQMRSSLVNNKREYSFPATQYSRLGV